MWSCIVMLAIHQRYRRTDGRTDRQTDDMQSQDCALHHSTSRGKTETNTGIADIIGVADIVARWAVAQTCCITPELIAMKLGVHNYVVDPTWNSKYGSDRATWVLSAHAWNITVCDFLFFLSFFRFFNSPTNLSPRLTDFHDLYVKQRVFAQGSAFGVSMMNFHIYPFLPQNVKISITAYGNFERQ